MTITANNNPFAILQGTATGFGCTPGRPGGGGVYAACGLNDGDGAYDLVIMPGGCDGTTSNPTCAGNDGAAVSRTWGVTGNLSGVCFINDNSCKNAQNSQTIALLQSVGIGTFPANEYCQNMIYGGYSDWYLPNQAAMVSQIYPAKTAGLLSGFAASEYWSSNQDSSAGYSMSVYVNMGSGTVSANARSLAFRVRCVRRHDLPLPSPVYDNDPDALANYPHRLVTESSGTRLSTAVFTPTGFNQMNVSISGASGNPKLKVNGGVELSSGTMNVGQTIGFLMDAPSTPGTENSATITLGADSYMLYASYADPLITRYMFVTNTTTNGAGPPQAQCSADAAAAGLSGTWSHFASSGSHMRLTVPWNWGTLKRIDGATIATSWEDLWDGSIDNPINITAAGGTQNGTVWTGSSDDRGFNAGNNCYAWTNAGGEYGYYGMASLSGAGWLRSNSNLCNNAHYAYCIQSTAGSDTDPVDVSFGRKVTYSSGTRLTSAAVTITGISSSINVSISGASGNPKLKINGGAEVSSGTADLVSTIEAVMDAPTVPGTENTALITLGTDTNIPFKAAYADGSRMARVFVTPGGYAYNSGGINTWDAACDSLGDAASGYAATWKAIASTSTAPANTRVGWNWGELQLLGNGATVANNWDDLWDGSIDTAINLDQNGVSRNVFVWTGTATAGLTGICSGTTGTYQDWGQGGPGGSNANVGSSQQAAAAWVVSTSCYSGGGTLNLYCMDDGSGPATDTYPDAIVFPYVIQFASSSRATSDPVTISGLGAGVAADVVLTGASGNPKYTVNGGAEQSSGTGTDVQNGDVLRLKMDSPAANNSSYLMTVTVGSGPAVNWRVWTGDSTGTVVKRAFVTSTSYNGISLGGLAGADGICQARADAATLGGTWKAILSGNTEANAAVNRIGYNWSTLKLVDNTTVVTTAGNLWKTGTTPFSNAIGKNESNAAVSGASVWTNTTDTGFNVYTTDANTCTEFSANTAAPRLGVNSATGPTWANSGSNGTACNSTTYRIYCIEQ